MSEAVDDADVLLYGVSLACENAPTYCRLALRSNVAVHVDECTDKESGNCRLEASYAHQQEVDVSVPTPPLPLLIFPFSSLLYILFATAMPSRLYAQP